MSSKRKDQGGVLKRTWVFLWKTLFLLWISHFLYLVALKWIMPPLTLTQLDSWLSGDGLRRSSLPLKYMSDQAAWAVIAAEDQLFAEHEGFDWESIEKAMSYNQRNPQRIRGASTISQQTAKNVFLWQGRSWFRKGLEFYCTFLIEKIWGKKRILEIYLNVAQTGKGIYGMEAAAHEYFQLPASSLTSRQAAIIAACLPNPERYSVKEPSSYVKRRTQWVLRQMNNLRGDKKITSLLNHTQN